MSDHICLPLSVSELLLSRPHCHSTAQWPLCTQPGHDLTTLHNHAQVPIVVAPIMYSIGAALPISLSLRGHFSDSNLASLQVRPDRKRTGKVFLTLYSRAVLFSALKPFSAFQCFYIPSSVSYSSHINPPLFSPVKFFCHS